MDNRTLSARNRRILGGALPLILGLCACGAETKIECLLDSDCAPDQTCGPAHMCVTSATPKCVSDQDCPEGNYCTRGGCSSTAGCTWDQDCASGYICEQHACERVQCSENGQCTPKVCSRGRCTEGCDIDADCGADQICQEGACNPTCKKDEACGAGRVCRSGRCQAECAVSADCGGGQVCAAGRCITPECQGDSDCTGSQRCRDYHCVASRPCEDDSVCGADERCAGGYCVVPECLDSTACKPGFQCETYRCVLTTPAGQAVEVGEEAQLKLSIPAAATVTDPGGSPLGEVKAVDGGVLFTSTGCVPGQAPLTSHVRLADGTVQAMTSTITVVDPGPPAETQLRLTDDPTQRVVVAEFSLPPENPSGRHCSPARYVLLWDDNGEQRREVEITSREPGDVISERLPVVSGAQVQVRLQVLDEQSQVTETTAELAITRARVTRFEFTANDLAPTQAAELSWAGTGISRVQILRDGEVVYDGPEASGSRSFPVGGRASTFALRYYDGLGNPFNHPITRQLQIQGTVEAEPNNSRSQATAMVDQGAGYVRAGEVDFWRLRNQHLGGQLALRSAEIAGGCISQLRMELLDGSGAVIAAVEGACPSLSGAAVANLASGAHYLRVTGLGSTPSDYVIGVQNPPPSCGNNISETRAGEQCDGWTACNRSCEAELRLNTATPNNLRRVDVPNLTEARVQVVVGAQSWIDIGTGDYLTGACPIPNALTLEDANFNQISATAFAAPSGCGRIQQRLNPGTYYVHIRANGSGSGATRVNLIGAPVGVCGDGVTDPTGAEECDAAGGSSECMNDCKVPIRLPGVQTPAGSTVYLVRSGGRYRITCRTIHSNDQFDSSANPRIYSISGQLLRENFDFDCDGANGITVNTPAGFYMVTTVIGSNPIQMVITPT